MSIRIAEEPENKEGKELNWIEKEFGGSDSRDASRARAVDH
jgi:hypothetical protein